MKTKIGIIGFGNLGKAILKNSKYFEDLSVFGVFTRRNPKDFQLEVPVFSLDDLEDYQDKLDCIILCGGSQDDIPKQGPEFLKKFNTIDSYDNHNHLPEYIRELEEISKKSGKTAITGIGWDPGLFSLFRSFFTSLLPESDLFTLWGPGLSQGHSQAVSKVDGVKRGVQYTIPKEEKIEKIRQGEIENLTAQEGHERVCYIVPEEGAHLEKIEEEIIHMPDYFEGYDTKVHFISEEDFLENHQQKNHGGFVLASQKLDGMHQYMEFSLKLDSNPDFTAVVNCIMARAMGQLKNQGKVLTIYDIPPVFYFSESREEMIRKFL